MELTSAFAALIFLVLVVIERDLAHLVRWLETHDEDEETGRLSVPGRPRRLSSSR